MAQRSMIKDNLNSRFSEIYETKTIYGNQFFVSRKGVPFRICTMAPNMVVVEYADTWEDGDVFYCDEQSESEIFQSMLKEIEG
ncbi:MAG: hypothetical protein IJH64_08455 [Oscillospiraceae bacterium]|nr:hypothetical protein [Oscillospiraceae bacterium]